MRDWTTIAINGLSVVGAVASIGGLCITALVYLRVKNLERRYVRMGVLPKHVRKLAGFAKNLDNATRAKDVTVMQVEVNRCCQVLNAIHPILTESNSAPAAELGERIKSLSGLEGYELSAFCEQFLIDVQGECERLRLMQTEESWRHGDGT